MTRALRRALIAIAAVASLTGESAQNVGAADVFAEGVISKPGTYGITFAQDGATLYVVQSLGADEHSAIWQSHLRQGSWSAPEPVAFSGEYDDFDPFLSPDGSRLFFASTRPLPGRPPKNPALWVVERTARGWSAPSNLGETINGRAGVRLFPAVAANGNLYFSGTGPGLASQNDIYYAPRVNGRYDAPRNLGPAVNSPYSDYDAWVAPDESFLVFVSDRPAGIGRRDFYISTRKNGAWTPARNLGPAINSAASREACCPAVRPEVLLLHEHTRREARLVSN